MHCTEILYNNAKFIEVEYGLIPSRINSDPYSGSLIYEGIQKFLSLSFIEDAEDVHIKVSKKLIVVCESHSNDVESLHKAIAIFKDEK